MKVDRDRLWNHLQFLCEDIGPRLSGTPEDERAVEYIASHFRKCGARVEVQDYACPSWEHESTELTLLAPGTQQPLPAFAQTFTEACDVEAEYACVGTREELEFAPDLDGKVLVLCDRLGTSLAIDRNPALLIAEERRAAAIVAVSPSETVSTKMVRDPFLRVPAAAVAQSVGVELRRSEGGRLRLRIRARRYDSTGHNVIGRFPGEEPGHIVVPAHYDTSAESPGATDNASGTAVVLELCELLAASGKRRLGVDFIAYGAEEYGRNGENLGAVEYVRRHPAEVAQARALVEPDCIGTAALPPRVRVMGLPAGQNDAVVDVLQKFARYLVDVRPDTEPARTCFHLSGLPALWFVNDYNKLPIHTAQDTIDLVSPDELAYSAEAIAAVVAYLGSDIRVA
jgi:hypothetical protein